MTANIDRILADARAEEALEGWQDFDRYMMLAAMTLPSRATQDSAWFARLHIHGLRRMAAREIETAKSKLEGK